MSNFTNETILKLLQKGLNSNKIKIERKGNFPSIKNKNVQHATIIVKSNDRPNAFELVEDFLNKNNINHKEKKLPGSSFNGIEITSDNYLPLTEKDFSIRILFKFANGQDTAARTGTVWNDLLLKVFSENRSLARIPRERSEVEVIKKINAEIQKLGSGKPIDLQIKSKRYKNVAGIVGGFGTKKADLVIVDYDGKEVGFISYKLGSNATGFQQYGGITDRASTAISNHDDVLDFKDLVVDNWDTYKDDYKTLWRPITENKLKKMAVFGPDYDKKSGYDSVDFIAQGIPRLKKVGATTDKRSILKLNFSTKVVNKNNITALQGDYEPTLAARSGEQSRRIINRNGKSKSGIRGGIYTRSYVNRRKSKEI